MMKVSITALWREHQYMIYYKPDIFENAFNGKFKK